MASTYLTRTAGSPTLNTKYTISLWLKRASLSDVFIIDGRDDASNRFKIQFGGTGAVECFNTHGGSETMNLTTNRLLRDTSAFYHLVLAVDTTQSTSSDRAKLYINGVQETSFSTATYPSQNDANNVINESGKAITIGAYNNGSGYQYHFGGLMTHVHFVDGTALTPATFGETDSTSGIWKPKASPSGITYGNNGFFLKFENSGAMGTDSSGNSNTFTVNGALTQNTDTPTNVFANLNPLMIGTGTSSNAVTFTAGNNRIDVGNNVWRTCMSTLAVSSGKWYFEGFGGSTAFTHYGIISAEKLYQASDQWDQEINANTNGYGYGYYGHNGNIYYSTTSASANTAYGNTYTGANYIGIFVDLDNNKLYFSKDGTLQNSGTGYTISADGSPYFLAVGIYGNNLQVNFGSGTFGYSGTSYAKLTGTTYADANGHGVFKYSPNQGGASNFDSAAKNFYTLNTKNLKEFG